MDANIKICFQTTKNGQMSYKVHIPYFNPYLCFSIENVRIKPTIERKCSNDGFSSLKKLWKQLCYDCSITCVTKLSSTPKVQMWYFFGKKYHICREKRERPLSTVDSSSGLFTAVYGRLEPFRAIFGSFEAIHGHVKRF